MISPGDERHYDKNDDAKDDDFFCFLSGFFHDLLLFFLRQIGILCLILSIIPAALIGFISHFLGEASHGSGCIILSFNFLI